MKRRTALLVAATPNADLPIRLGITDPIAWLARHDHDPHMQATLDHLDTQGQVAEAVILLEAHIARTAKVRHQVRNQTKRWNDSRKWDMAVTQLRHFRGAEQVAMMRLLLTPPGRCQIERGQWHCTRPPHRHQPLDHVFVATREAVA